MQRTALLLAASLALLLCSGAAGRGVETPGVTATQILLGGTAPLSGVASGFASVARGAEAYFKYVNANGGVYGRQILYRYLDDAYDPGRTVQATKELVEQDKVFAIFNAVGTQPNLAVRDYLNQLGVPQLFAGTGANTFGRDWRQYPWTIGYLPSFTAEGVLYGRYLAKARPNAKIAVLYENDGYASDLIVGLKRGLGAKAKRIVASVGYDPAAPDCQSQVAELARSGADTFMVFATPKFAIQAFVFAKKLGWRPHAFVDQISSASNVMFLASEAGTNPVAKGTISIVFLKDPTSGRWANDPAIRLYRQLMRRYVPRGDPSDVYHGYGMAVAYTMVDALRQAGRNLTREGIMSAVTHLHERNPFALPGMIISTTPQSRFPIGQAQLERWDGRKWIAFGPLLSAR